MTYIIWLGFASLAKTKMSFFDFGFDFGSMLDSILDLNSDLFPAFLSDWS